MSEDQDAFEDEPVREGHPLAATIVCLLLLSLSRCGGASDEASLSSDAAMIGLVVGGGLIGLVLWAIAYAITIRRASLRWKAASLVVLVCAGLWTGAADLANKKEAFRRDVEASKVLLQQAQARKPGTAVQAPAGAGTLTRMAVATLNAAFADLDRQSAAQREAGMAEILQLRGLSKTSAVLDHCDRFDALEKRALALPAKYPLYVDAARAVADADVAAGKIDRPLTDNVLRGMLQNRHAADRRWERLAAQARTASQVCQILARRHWVTAKDGTLAFASNAEVAAVNAALRRLDPVPSKEIVPPRIPSI